MIVGEPAFDSLRDALLFACNWIPRVHHSGQTHHCTPKSQMDLMGNSRTHTFRSLEIYGRYLMTAEAFDPETAMDARDTFPTAIARHQPPKTQDSPTGDPRTIDELTVWAEAERFAQEAITNLYNASGANAAEMFSGDPLSGAGPSGAGGASVDAGQSGVSIALAIAAAATNWDERFPQAPVPRAPCLVFLEPETVRSVSIRDGGLPPVPCQLARTQTTIHDRVRGGRRGVP